MTKRATWEELRAEAMSLADNKCSKCGATDDIEAYYQEQGKPKPVLAVFCVTCYMGAEGIPEQGDFSLDLSNDFFV